jgi:hypothetical protein
VVVQGTQPKPLLLSTTIAAPGSTVSRDDCRVAREVAAGKFEQWQREAAKKPSSVTYTRIEYDRKAYWVVEASFGYGDPSEKIAVYAPTKDGSFRRCLLVGPIKAGKLTVAADAKTGVLELREEVRSRIKGEMVLSCNLKAFGVLP